MSRLSTSSVSLHFTDTKLQSYAADTAGDGPPLVLIHGWCCSGRSWDRLITELGGAYRMLALDLRGHGSSSIPSDHAFSPEALTNDILRVCAQQCVEKPVVVGHSYGAYLTAKLVERAPSFARGAVLIDQRLDLAVATAPLRAAAPVVRDLTQHMAFRHAALSSFLLPGEQLDEADLHAWRTTPPEVGLALWSLFFELTNEELGAESERLVRALDRVPTLFIDRAEVPGYDAWRRRLAPSSKSAVVPGGHWLHQSQTRGVAALIRAHASGVR